MRRTVRAILETRPLRLALCLLALQGSLATAQLQVATIHLRVLNGRNGKPVRQAQEILTLTSVSPYNTPLTLKTDKAGRMSALEPVAGELHTLAPHYSTCRRLSRAERMGPTVGYLVQQIVMQGMVSENSCGSHKASPVPGELTLYVRPKHWWEHTTH